MHLDKNETPLVIGDNVRVHTGEQGVVDYFIPGRLKSVHVLFRPGWGGTYFPFECEKATTGADESERAANAWYSAGQIEEMTERRVAARAPAGKCDCGRMGQYANCACGRR